MPPAWDEALTRWSQAGLLTPEQALQIRAFEQTQAPPHRLRWPVVVALAFGATLLSAGLLLLVAAHWNELSPTQRMALVIVMVGGIHVLGAFAASPFPALAVTMHAIGTAALGAGIALAGQIFHLQAHWPSGILLWALGAAAGYALLRQWPQAGLLAMLAPLWVGGEWQEWTKAFDVEKTNQILATGLLLLTLTYLSACRDHERSAVSRTLTALGSIGLIPAVIASIMLLSHRGYYYAAHPYLDLPLAMRTAGWALAVGLPLVLAFVLRRQAAIWNLAAAAWVVSLAFVVRPDETVGAYLWLALGCFGLTLWGVRESRRERINLGMACFALTVLTFYFSHLMDRLDRSLSLILLGVLFLGGGWLLERWRRRLIASMRAAS